MQDVRPVDTHVAIEGEDEHHEKKPVTTKVKERVKKLKNTVTKKIRGNNHDHDNDDDHDHDHDHDRRDYEHQRDPDPFMDEEEGEDDHDHDHDHDHNRRDYEHQRDRDLFMDEDEEEEGGYLEDDEDKLVDSNPEVHGAPMYGASTESAAVTGRERIEHEKVRAGETEDPPKKVRVGDAAVFDTAEDPAAPDSSTPQPRDGEVISSVSPIIQSFEAMSVADKPEGHGADREAVATPPTGSHEGEHDAELEDQRDLVAPPVSTGFHDQLSPEEPLKIDETEKQENQQSYTEKLKSAAAGTTEYGKKIASAAYDKAAVVLAKVRQPQGGGGAAVDPPTGSHEEEHDAVLEGQRELAAPTAPTGSNDRFSPENQQSYTEKLKSVAAGTTEYGKNIASAAYDKAAVAGAAVLSKVQQPQGGGAADTTGEEGSGNREKAVPVREYIAEKLKPGDEDKALSEVISDAMPIRKREIEHKASEEEATLGSEGRSEGEEIRHKAGEGVPGTEGWSGGETEQKESEEVISGGQTTEEKAGEEAAGSDERRGSGTVTMMEKIRGAVTSVTSLISSNGTGSKSPVTDSKEKGANADIVEGTN